MASPPLNIVLIGLGMVADTHLMALADLPEKLHLHGLYSRSAERVEGFASKVEDICGYRPRCYESLHQIASDQTLDMAIIATPPNGRSDIVAALVRAGLHILMEKPIERDGKRASAIVAMCRENGVKLGIVFQHRVREVSAKLKQLVDQQAFGALGVVEVNVPWWREQSYYDEPGRGTYERDGGGVLISQAIHSLDLMLTLTGPVSEVQALARKSRFHEMESEDFVSAGLVFDNGAVGSLVASTASYPGHAESITLHFENASAHLQSGRLELNWRDGRQESFGADMATGGGADPMGFTHAWHRDLFEDFANAVIDDRPPLATGEEALAVHHLIDAIIQSSNTGRIVQLS